MPYVRCKICGITNIEDANLAVDAGADAIGLILCKSKRQVSIQTAKQILETVPPFINKVLVVRDMSKDEINDIISNVPLFDTIQFHGNEDEDFCLSFGEQLTIIKAISISSLNSISQLARYKHLSYFLLDSHSGEYGGGSGVSFNLDYAIRIRDFMPSSKLILAGGLRADNVARAINKVLPYAVDVASGVEASYGKKDPKSLKDFIKRVREGV